MMKIKTHILYIIIIIVLVVLLVKPFAKSDRVKEFEDSTIDTLSFRRDTSLVAKIDTLEQDNSKIKIVYKEKIIKDTIIIRDTTIVNLQYSLPLVQKHFSVPNRYDLWISGIEPLSVDKINTYNQIMYRTITNTITEAIYPNRNELYLNGGLFSISHTFVPVVGVSLKTKRNVLISLYYGRYNGDNVGLVTAGYKLGKK